MTPAPPVCNEKQSLLRQIKQVIAQIIAIHNEEFEAIARGNFNVRESAHKQLTEALGLKAILMGRLWTHVQAHGCQSVPLKKS